MDPGKDAGKAGFERAIALFDEAVTRAPTYAVALVMAGYLHVMNAWNGYSDTPAEDRRIGLELVRRALRVGADDVDVLVYAGYAIASVGGDVATADGLADQAVSLNPGSAVVWWMSGSLKMVAGKRKIALQQFEAALRLNPAGHIDRLFSTRLAGATRC